ncbi:DUF4190 domain-containing protein [Mycolicibacterium celeriflavum]|uniref:Uncharacterized protein n=1 Tax=Mycolicibacterium celeriflavum TaxID=1249101 RepID=A0A1X0BQ42_MYCCF|nr:DUF4190 domain-containing protein [Mycolicibacterium celeriflavum]MCV7239999.1 DUF4190 domain-containing protein [Mycolicibacterium celeriflavum]ORA45419.1 DUF4190 domain-containing protein [Mycolicibacterium celeriflavum]BBY42711.1 hypothetical protein MCEL_10060 [Mycolicibacterium celeriflavum]
MSEPDKPETPPHNPEQTPQQNSPQAPPPNSPQAPPPPQQYGAYPGSYPPPPQGYPGYPPPPTAPKNGLGIASLVIAIVALVSVFGGIVLGVVAVILGFLGWGRAKRGEATNGGVAVAGIVLGFLSIIEAIVVIWLAVWGFNQVGGTDYIDCVSRAGNDQEAIQQCSEEFQQRVEDEFSMTLTPTP